MMQLSDHKGSTGGWGGGRVGRNILPWVDSAPPGRWSYQKLHGKENSSLKSPLLPNNPRWPPSPQGVLAGEAPQGPT